MPVQAGPVADLDRETEPGQRRDAPQAAEPVHDVGELAVRGHARDRHVESVTSVDGLDHRLVGGVERGLQTDRREPLRPQPPVVRDRPRLPSRVLDTLPQQQLADPVASRHQIAAGVYSGTHQIPRRLGLNARDGHLDDLPEPQQPGQMHRVTRVRLDPISDRSLQLRRRGD